MNWRHGAAVLTFTACVASSLSAPAQSPAVTQQTAQPSADPTLDRVEALLRANHWQAAHELLSPWLKANLHAPDRDRALYLLAQVYFESGDRIRSFYHLDELLDTYPGSGLFYPALDMQYRIADAYLSGFKDTFLGLPIVSETDEAIEMLYRIQERAPGSPIAEQALRRTANYYFNNSDFESAADAYDAFLRMYPRSPDIPQIKLRQAFASLAQFRGPRFDATPLLDARSRFKAIQTQYPDLAAEANVSQWIAHIDDDLARKGIYTADFYRRTGRPAAAVYLYRYVIQTYPNSPEAAQARRTLPRMPAWALARPAPPMSYPEAAAAPLPVPPADDSVRRAP